MCAVRELNETLQAGPSPFDWAALLVVPLAVAGVTLFVAWRGVVVANRSAKVAESALLVAKQSDQLARQVRADELEREQRRDREAFVEVLEKYLSVVAPDIETDFLEQPGTRSLNRYNDALVASAGLLHSDAEGLLRQSREQVKRCESISGDRNFDIAVELVVGGVRMAARRWVADPAGGRQMLEKLASIGLDEMGPPEDL